MSAAQDVNLMQADLITLHRCRLAWQLKCSKCRLMNLEFSE